MTTENTIMKVWLHGRSNRSLSSGFIFHSDRGAQYASNKMRNLFSFKIERTNKLWQLTEKKFWLVVVALVFISVIVVKYVSYETKAGKNVNNCLKVEYEMSIHQIVEIMGKPNDI